MRTIRLFAILLLLSPLPVAAAGAPAKALEYNDLVQKVQGLAGARQHGEALGLVGDALARDDLTGEQRRALAFRAADMIHSAAHSAYPLLRETLEKALVKVPLDDAGKYRMLEGIEGTYARTRNPGQAAAVRKRMLELKLTEPQRIHVLSGLAQICIHQLRRPNEGRTYYHEAIPLLRKAADALDDPVAKAGRLTAIADIYQCHTREREKAVPLLEEALGLYQKALPGLEPRPGTQVLAAQAALQRLLGRHEEAQASEEQAVAGYVRILEEAEGLPTNAWVEAVAPLQAVQILRNTAEGCRRALALAERMFEMRDDPAVRPILNSVLVQAELICRSGKDAGLRSRVSSVIEKQLSLAGTPRAQHSIRLRLAESYFRIDRDLEKARHAFAAVAADEAAAPADREAARLWCEILSDEE